MDEDWSVSPVTNAAAGQGVVAARHERQRQPLRRVRRVHRRRGRTQALGLAARRISRAAQRTRAVAAPARRCAITTASARWPASRALPKELKHLAWLVARYDADGQEYWAAMNLMGRYAAANHALIHQHIAREARRARVARHREPSQLRVEGNARRERRRARGHRASQRRDARGRRRARDHSRLDGVARLRRARQGYRRVAEHRVARRGPRDEPHEGECSSFTWERAKQLLAERGVELLSAGLDEVPSGLQGHPRTSWPRRPIWSKSSASSIRSS